MTAAAALPDAGQVWREDARLMALIGVAHGVSHFSQLLLPPLFPFLRESFDASYTELGFLMTVFFVVSCAVQTASGFLVDRHGPRPILFWGLGLIALAALGAALAPSYPVLLLCVVVAGVGNGVFHPVDYTLINKRVSPARLGHAYSVHGISGSLGWALAPALMVPIALASSWRWSLAAAAALALVVMGVLAWQREHLGLAASAPAQPPKAGPAPAASSPVPGNDVGFDFLRIPAVWMCFAFFFFYAGALSVIQAFAPQAARELHAVPLSLVAVCLSIYMLGSAGGMVMGGFLASDPARCERIVAMGFGAAACLALLVAFASQPPLAVPVIFGLMGFVTGTAGPSRDLLVKKSTPENATGRVYGVVYSGLDIGQAVAPLVFGPLMDAHRYRGVWLGLVVVQGVLIFSAFRVRRVSRQPLGSAAPQR